MSQSSAIHADVAQHAGRYLTFILAGEEYGLGILKVQEIIGIMSITRVPRTPDFVRGVINLRGRVIPIVDLRRKLCLEAAADTDQTCIIVTQVQGADQKVTIGLVADSVSEVRNIAEASIEPTPKFGFEYSTEFILGMGKVDGRVVILLDADRVLSAVELAETENGARA